MLPRGKRYGGLLPLRLTLSRQGKYLSRISEMPADIIHFLEIFSICFGNIPNGIYSAA